jgi:predicted signal transduction protein with EAL and GGDEF domain
VIASHLSNDIYCLGIYNPYGEYSIERFIEKIRKRLEKPFKMSSGHEVSVCVSFSIAEFPDHAESALDLINCADIAMFKSKTMGNNQIIYFDARMLDEFLHNVDMENKLNSAVLNNNFEVYFQPQFHSSTKKLRGMEALVRWRDEEKGFIAPSVFIPIAEKNGSIIPIGNFVLDNAIRQLAEWEKKYEIDFTMSVNISAVQYKRDDFVDSVIEVIDKYKVDPQNIELEITESVLIEDFEIVTDKLIKLRKRGIKISLDFFLLVF